MREPGTDLYFFHIPKTAGTSLGKFLRRLYPEDERFEFIRPEHLLAMSRAEINRHRYFHGHVGNLLYLFLGREVPTTTFLRDPFEQTISWLRWRDNERGPKRLLWFLNDIRLDGYRSLYGPRMHRRLDRFYGRGSFRDFQARMLGTDITALDPNSGVSLERQVYLQWKCCEEQLGMDGVLEQAKRRLDSMAVVGITERFDESLGLLCDFLKVPAPEKSPVERVAPGRSVRSSYRNDPTVPPALVRFVERHTTFDRQVYAHANALLDRQLNNTRLSPVDRNSEDTPRQAA